MCLRGPYTSLPTSLGCIIHLLAFPKHSCTQNLPHGCGIIACWLAATAGADRLARTQRRRISHQMRAPKMYQAVILAC
jgi:hypothetical protein